MKKFDKDNVFRTTKCFSPMTNRYPGGFPVGFIKYLQKNNWWGNERVYLCCGMVDDKEAIRVDIKPEVNPSHLEDARNTTLKSESSDCIIIDPPYSKELAKSMYGTEKHWSWINSFTKEALRICKPNGLIITLSYEVPKRIPDCDLIACIGVYQAMSVAHMRCLSVWRKQPQTKKEKIR